MSPTKIENIFRKRKRHAPFFGDYCQQFQLQSSGKEIFRAIAMRIESKLCFLHIGALFSTLRRQKQELGVTNLVEMASS